MDTYYEIEIPRVLVHRVLSMPGLSRIDLGRGTATLRFDTAEGCQPCGAEFLASEVERMGAQPIRLVTVESLTREGT